jgi:hypothetical protein
MDKMTVGSMDIGEIERISDEIYDGDFVRNTLFPQVYNRFPDCNVDPYDATDWMLDRIDEEFDLEDKYAAADYERIRDHLCESIDTIS